MANTGFKGIDVRQTGTEILFRASLKDATGAKVTSGTTTLMLYEYQSDGTINSYDFNDNTFKSTALTTATLALTHRKGNNGTQDTGVWTATLATLTGFTVGALYLVQINNTGASPTDQEREFQFGSAQGDLVTTAVSTGTAYVETDTREFAGQTITCAGAVTILANVGTATHALVVDSSGNVTASNVTAINSVATTSITAINANLGTTQPINFNGTGASAYVKSDVEQILGTTSAGAAGYVGIDWSKIANASATVDLSGTTIGGIDGDIGPIRTGTCQAGSTSSTIKLDSGASATDHYYDGCGVYTTGGTGAGQFRWGQFDYSGTNKTLTVVPNWITTPDGTTSFALLPGYMPANLGKLVISSAGVASADAKAINAVSTSSVTVVNANMGTTQPVNFDGTGSSAYVKSDLEHWKASAPASLTTNGYVQVTMLRWLTDNAAGTPNALTAGKLDALDVIVSGTCGGGTLAAFQLASVPGTPGQYDGCKVRIISGTATRNQSAFIQRDGDAANAGWQAVTPQFFAAPTSSDTYVICGDRLDANSLTYWSPLQHEGYFLFGFTSVSTYQYINAMDVDYNGGDRMVCVGNAQDGTPAVAMIDADGKWSQQVGQASNGGAGIALPTIPGFSLTSPAGGLAAMAFDHSASGASKFYGGGGATISSVDYFMVLKFTGQALLDTTYNTTGIVTLNLAGTTEDRIAGMVLDSSGRVVFCGSVKNGSNYEFVVGRLTTAGAWDTTFNTTGYNVVSFGTTDQAFSLAIQSDGKIVVGGGTTTGGLEDYAICRLNTDGTLDSSFGTGGKVTLDLGTAGDECRKILIQSDGKILAIGWTATQFSIVRLTTAGALDTTYNGTGKQFVSFYGVQDWAWGGGIDPNGKCVAVGYTHQPSTFNSPSLACMCRLNTDGSLDTTFGTGGKVIANFGSNGNDQFNDIRWDRRGNLLLAGWAANWKALIARYRPDGTLDAKAPRSATVAANVLDAQASDHNITGTIGANINTAATGGDPWPTDLPGSYLPGSAGYILGHMPSLGTGARTVTITVTDGTNPLQNAVVRMTTGANTFVGSTDVSGNVTFNLDDATYTVAIALSGYSFSGASLVISADTTHTYAMTIIVITPSTAGFTTGYLTVYDENGVVESGVVITAQATEADDAVLGIAVSTTARTATSASNGLVQFTNMLLGVSYKISRGTTTRKEFVVTIPDTAGSTYELPSILGTP